eukprot:5093617-Pyramimonas_sp.AAC.1
MISSEVNGEQCSLVTKDAYELETTSMMCDVIPLFGLVGMFLMMVLLGLALRCYVTFGVEQALDIIVRAPTGQATLEAFGEADKSMMTSRRDVMTQSQSTSARHGRQSRVLLTPNEAEG